MSFQNAEIINRVQKLNYLGTDGVKCDTETGRHIGIMKEVFQKINIVSSHEKYSTETKKSVLNRNVISIFLYGIWCWKFSLQMKWIEATETGFYRRMQWPKPMSNEGVLKKRKNRKTLIFQIRKSWNLWNTLWERTVWKISYSEDVLNED